MSLSPNRTDENHDHRRAELRSLLLECDVECDEMLEDRTPLISSGLLDSLALFRVALWIEEQICERADPSAFDLAAEWDSIELILDFIDRTRSGESRIAPRNRSQRAAPPTPRIRIVRYTPSYKRAVAELQTNLWCEDPKRNLEYLDWKYERNPCPSGSHIFLALDGDDVVGMRGFHPSRWESGSFGSIDLLVADDSVVRPEHRNRGITNQIMQEALPALAELGIEYVFNFSGSLVTVLSSLAAGWRSIGAMEPIHRTSPLLHLNDRIRRLLGSTPFLWRYASSSRSPDRSRNPFHRVDRVLKASSTPPGTHVRISRMPEPEQMARLVRHTLHDGRMRAVRDATFLRWRYENPLHDYRFFYLGNEHLDGYLVVKCSTASSEATPTVHIVDLEANDDSSRMVLLDAAVRSSLFDALVVWSATLTPPSRAFLTKLKFTPLTASAVPGHPCLLVRTTDESRLTDDWCLGGARLTDLSNWDMRMIYSMAG